MPVAMRLPANVWLCSRTQQSKGGVQDEAERIGLVLLVVLLLGSSSSVRRRKFLTDGLRNRP